MLIICSSPQLDDGSVLMTGLDIVLAVPGERISTGFKFSYTPNPGITKVQPLETIIKYGLNCSVLSHHLFGHLMQRDISDGTQGLIMKCLIGFTSFKRNNLDRYKDTIHQYNEHLCITMQSSNISLFNNEPDRTYELN